MPACESLCTLPHRISNQKQGNTSGGNSYFHKHGSWCSRFDMRNQNKVKTCLQEAQEGPSCSSHVGGTVRHHHLVGFGKSGVRRGCKIGVDVQVPMVP